MISRSGDCGARCFLLWLLVVLVVAATTTEAFVVVNPSSSCFQWELSAVKRGKGLRTLADDGVAPPVVAGRTAPKMRSKRGKSTTTSAAVKQKTKNKSTTEGGGGTGTAGTGQMAPKLAEWMASQEGKGNDASTAAVEQEQQEDSVPEAVSFETFEKESTSSESSSSRTTNRRDKQSVRKEQDARRDGQLDQAIDALEDALKKTKNLDGILSSVQNLMQLPSDSLRQLVAGKQTHNYRLTWVGSDDAICHVGTGLHKVPLARLQEIFLTCLGKNRLELLEVISILGPFPNIKNTLQGTTKLNAGGAGEQQDSIKGLQIVMDSMVDGTGKEILAGTEDNIRRVDLQIYFSDERAIVAVVPPEDGNLRADPLQDNGKHVLVFVKEDDLDAKLDSLRVS
jgi:hypothetical protein